MFHSLLQIPVLISIFNTLHSLQTSSASYFRRGNPRQVAKSCFQSFMTKAPCHPCTSHVTRSMLTYLPSTDTGLHRYVGNGHQSIHGVCTDQLNCLHVLAAVVRAACLRRRAPRWPDLMHPGFALSGQTGAKSQKAPNTQGLLPLRHARPCKSDSLLNLVSSVSKGMETCPPEARYAILLSLARILLTHITYKSRGTTYCN